MAHGPPNAQAQAPGLFQDGRSHPEQGSWAQGSTACRPCMDAGLDPSSGQKHPQFSAHLQLWPWLCAQGLATRASLGWLRAQVQQSQLVADGQTNPNPGPAGWRPRTSSAPAEREAGCRQYFSFSGKRGTGHQIQRGPRVGPWEPPALQQAIGSPVPVSLGRKQCLSDGAVPTPRLSPCQARTLLTLHRTWS